MSPLAPALALAVLAALPLSAARAQDPAVRRVATGFGFVEGPAWDPVKGVLLFSDIRGDTIHELDSGEVTAFLEPSARSNGLAFDAEGNLYACLGGARQVVRIAPDGTRTVLADFGQNFPAAPAFLPFGPVGLNRDSAGVFGPERVFRRRLDAEGGA